MQPLTLSGRVEKGEGIARELGCPTANIAVEQGGVIPALGVYVGDAELEQQHYPSLVCINDGRTGVNLKMEVHLLDQEADLTGKKLTVVLLEKIRDLIPFPGSEHMTQMIRDDMEKSRTWFKNHPEIFSQK
ncbi:MAG: riboflavin kinase [Patescibacteria group bacterium]